MKSLLQVFASLLLIPCLVQAQGTIYFSNVGQTSVGSLPIGSDSWYAADFQTGNNGGGYDLNSIQLGMTSPSGNPSGFSVMIYSSYLSAVFPRNLLGTLVGSANPSASGTYTYTPAETFSLAPYENYFIVVTSGTSVQNGAYAWNLSGQPYYYGNGGWSANQSDYTSANGLTWNSISSSFSEFAVNASPLPEPSTWSLLLLGGGVFVYGRRKLRVPLVPSTNI